MNLSTLLTGLRMGARFVDPPDGPRIEKVTGIVQGNLQRIRTDCPALQDAAADLLPIIQKHGQFFVDIGNWASKHWKPVFASVNDLIPIVEAILADLKE